MIIRATGILIEDNKLLLLKQYVNSDRNYSLPGGTLEEGETLEQCLVREMKEETGLDVKLKRLLYICDHLTENKHVVHITFEAEKTGGSFSERLKDLDSVKIEEVEMVELDNLKECGLSDKFIDLVKNNFPNAGSYMGDKKNIGL